MDKNIENQFSSKSQWVLLFSVLVVAICGLIYELVAGTLASYLLGDSITQFSLIIGIYLFSMGIGSYLSKYFNQNLLDWFVRIELLVGLVGGISAPVLFLSFPLVDSFKVILYGLVVIIGILVGIEIPLLLKILKDKLPFSDLVSRVFTFDYIGALLASLIFPLLFVPRFGLIKTSLFFGILNICIGLILCFFFKKHLKHPLKLKTISILLLVLQIILFAFGDKILDYSDSLNYEDQVIYAKNTPYQRLVITKHKSNISLYINGNLQFSSKDEYRYHEALVHPVLSMHPKPEKVLVLGGGDGLAIREILKYSTIKKIDLVDLDPEMTRLFTHHTMLSPLNHDAFKNPKVHIINDDAFIWLKKNDSKYDCIIVDFPDPSGFAVGKLYTNSFYRELQKKMTEASLFVVQSTSPLVAPKSYWCVNNTIQSVGFHTIPYHNYVPSFGEWGYIIGTLNENHLATDIQFDIPTKFINKDIFSTMLAFSPDMEVQEKPEINKLNNQILVRYFEEEWSKYIQ